MVVGVVGVVGGGGSRLGGVVVGGFGGAVGVDMGRRGGIGGGNTFNINASPMPGGFLALHRNELAKLITSMHRDNQIKFA